MYENCVVEEGWGGGGVEGGVEVEVRVALGGVEGMSSIVWGGGWGGGWEGVKWLWILDLDTRVAFFFFGRETRLVVVGLWEEKERT